MAQMTDNEFSDWFDQNIGTEERYGAAWQTYEYFSEIYEKQIQELKNQIKSLQENTPAYRNQQKMFVIGDKVCITDKRYNAYNVPLEIEDINNGLVKLKGMTHPLDPLSLKLVEK